ncbi:hypothetical protein ATY41_10820 [Leifsonia xyli subsp. xyli]|uniref:Uncharacterized protein n=2 Tax=Leifsonia xyli subsp. xyli TaxID=59736 RepID=Q6AGT7_LEIXX|nr:hypothetical protein [Leifsonia xyli]AAT88408.1 hypothetical protein Lxx04050 [Leifsonia xyli subsp. xyli str. CTCB07]ODA90241.1 hypothetical protein ATY41_10820 [Leifsonia xyli subsp. xyli]
MAPTSTTTYTAKLLDGPLEGKTIAMTFLDEDGLRPRLELPSTTAGKRFVYVRAASAEVEFAPGDARTPLPSAAAYRYVETVFD